MLSKLITPTEDETLANGYLPMAFIYRKRLSANKQALKGAHQRIADLRSLGAQPSDGVAGRPWLGG